MATNQDLQRRIQELARMLCSEFGVTDADEGECWLETVENRAVAIGDAISAAMIAEHSHQRPQPSDEATCPQCGKTGRYTGDRQRELSSRRGPVSLAEPEYYCPCCRKAFFPSHSGVGH